MRRWAASLAGAMLLVTSVSGCAGAATKTVDHTEAAVALRQGEALEVDFGEINGSVGDEWVITRQPDEDVLGPGDARTRYLGEADSVGGPSELTYRFEPVGSGTTTIAWEYRFRGEAPGDPDAQKTAEITVTVE